MTQPSQSLLLVLFLVLSFIIGTLTIFYGIAELATVTKLFPKAQISLALTQNEVVYSTVSLLAPALATFLLGISHPLPFAIDALSYLILLISLLCIRASFQEQRDESSHSSHHILIDIREGLQWVRQRPIICLFIVLAGYLEVIVSVNVLLLPVIAQHAQFPLGFVGVILAAGGIGNLLGTALGTFLQRHVQLGWGLIGTLLLFVVLWPLYGFVTNAWLLGVLIAAFSLIDSVAYLFTTSYRLAIVSDALQGRVGSIARLSLFSFLTIGPPLVGICLQRFGVGPTVGVLWVGFLLFALLALFYPRVRHASFPKE